jgi:CPA2 family monovalent cation:H+ antiporter-2
MLLAESPFAVQIRSDVGALRTLFVTLFFASVGMMADPAWFLANWAEVLLWLLGVFFGKAIIIYAVCRVFKMGHAYALATGIILAQIGEFSFVLATVARQGGLIDQHVASLAVSVAILSMLLAPYMVSYAQPLARWLVGLLTRSMPEREAPAAVFGTAAGRVYIIGFGPSGHRVAEALLQQGIRPEVIELNPRSAAAAEAMGLRVHIGDASGGEVLSHAGIRGSCVIVVTVPDPGTARLIVRNVRVMTPESIVIARSRYHIAHWEIERSGAAIVVDEENLMGRELAREVLDFLKRVDPMQVSCALPPGAGDAGTDRR